MAGSIGTDNFLVMNQGLNPAVGFNFMLRVEGIYDLPCKSVRAFTKENEYEIIQEGGLNDYVHMRRKPISKPFTFEVERYVGVDYLDPLPNGAELLLPVILIVSRSPGSFAPDRAHRTFTFTGCTVTKKEFGQLDASRSELLTETITIAYRELLVVDLPWTGALDVEFDSNSEQHYSLMAQKALDEEVEKKKEEEKDLVDADKEYKAYQAADSAAREAEEKARASERTARNDRREADMADRDAQTAEGAAQKAKQESEKAADEASKAQEEAARAKEEAANNPADEAKAAAAAEAEQKAADAQKKSDEAKAQSDAADKKAEEARKKADAADQKATDSQAKAETERQAADKLKKDADAAYDKWQEARKPK